VPAALLLILAPLVNALKPAPTPPPADVTYRSEIEAWRAARLARLTAEDGWLSVVGLFWLEEGVNTVGSAKDNTIVLPGSAPAHMGSVLLRNGRATLEVLPGIDITADGERVSRSRVLASDAARSATLLRSGSLLFYLIERRGKLAVRVKDSRSQARRDFHGLEYFPIDPTWRLEARFEPYDPPKSISVPNVLGHDDSEKSPGALVFERDGQTYRLDPVLERGETDYFVIFGDATNGTETYGAGRFLYVAPPVDGKTVIDFNRAYNPPCVFTDYATCPLPPAQNRLRVRVVAGEKEYAHP
jgi:uncharacterized protein (DUF1684 family)